MPCEARERVGEVDYPLAVADEKVGLLERAVSQFMLILNFIIYGRPMNVFHACDFSGMVLLVIQQEL